jgi:GNAT superfamily N-acetyltransferase
MQVATPLAKDPMKAKIRLSRPTDARALKSADSVVPVDRTRAGFIDEWLREDTVVVAELDGRMVGYGVLNHGFFHRSQVEMLMVHQEYRGRRIGGQLLKALERLCDTSKLFVTTNLSNHGMQRLLTRMGYAGCGCIDELDPGDPELVFVKKVKPGTAKPSSRCRGRHG